MIQKESRLDVADNSGAVMGNLIAEVTIPDELAFVEAGSLDSCHEWTAR